MSRAPDLLSGEPIVFSEDLRQGALIFRVRVRVAKASSTGFIDSSVDPGAIMTVLTRLTEEQVREVKGGGVRSIDCMGHHYLLMSPEGVIVVDGCRLSRV